MGTDGTIRRWFAVHTKPRQESTAEQQLKLQGYKVYCPRLLDARRRRGKWRQVIEPLFPRYLFIKLAEGMDNFAPIRSTIGVCDMVRVGRIPKSVPETLIQEIRARENGAQGMVVNPSPWYEGLAVEFVNGPFAGFHGIFKASCGNERALILLRFLNQDNEVVITQDAIVPA
jgi:transcriptional antiterminator RfaH